MLGKRDGREYLLMLGLQMLIILNPLHFHLLFLTTLELLKENLSVFSYPSKTVPLLRFKNV